MSWIRPAVRPGFTGPSDDRHAHPHVRAWWEQPSRHGASGGTTRVLIGFPAHHPGEDPMADTVLLKVPVGDGTEDFVEIEIARAELQGGQQSGVVLAADDGSRFQAMTYT